MFIFDARDIISYEVFSSFLDKSKEKFLIAQKKIFEKYGFLEPRKWDGNIKKYQCFRNKHCNLVQNTVHKVFKFYEKFLPSKYLMFEFGSFTKRTERIYSDIDFTICYDEPKNNDYECIEEVIDFTIASILGYSIDHVHGNFQHYPKHPEFDCLSNDDNLYQLIFDEKKILYKCGPGTLGENLTNIKNVRDYKTLLRGFKIKYQRKADIDSLYSIKIYRNLTEHDFLKELEIMEKKNDICKGYEFKKNYTSINEYFSISEIKHILKNDGIVEFYNFIASLRKRIKISNSYSMNIEMIWNNSNMKKLFGVKYVYALREAFVEFIFHWNRIEYSLRLKGVPLSTRCYRRYSIDEMNLLLAKDWLGTTTILDVINSKNKLTELIIQGLKILE